MEIIEQQIIGKRSMAACEDGLVITPQHAAVIDGSTSKSPVQIHPHESNGRLAMLIVADVIRSMAAQTSLEAFCRMATDAIAEAYDYYAQDMAVIREHPERRLTCSAAVYSHYYQEVWLVGDCQCLIDGRLYENNKPEEATNAARRSRYILDHGLSVEAIRRHDEGRDHIVKDIIASMRGQNKTYAVIDGTPIYQQGIRLIPTTEAHEIVLATDGYPFLYPTLAESEAALQQLLHDDPLLIHRYQATKAWMEGNESFDDRTYLRIKEITSSSSSRCAVRPL